MTAWRRTFWSSRAKSASPSATSNTKGADNIITNGSVIAVARRPVHDDRGAGQGRGVLLPSRANSSMTPPREPTIFCGQPGRQHLVDTFETIRQALHLRRRDPPRTSGCTTSTPRRWSATSTAPPAPSPSAWWTSNIGLDMDVGIRCFGEYSYKIADPMLFYTNVCGNVSAGLHPRPAGQPAEDPSCSPPCSPPLPAFQRHGHPVQPPCPATPWSWRSALNEVLSAKWRRPAGHCRSSPVACQLRHRHRRGREDASRSCSGPPSSRTPPWRRRTWCRRPGRGHEDRCRKQERCGAWASWA